MKHLKKIRPLLYLFAILIFFVLIKFLFIDEKGLFEKEGKVYDIYFSDKYKRSPSAWDFGQTIKEKVLVAKLYTGDPLLPHEEN